MGLEVGGFGERPHWPKMDPSPPLATCLILAIRAAHLAGRAMTKLVSTTPSLFPAHEEPWFPANDDDAPL